MTTLYEKDFCAWSTEQSELIRKGNFGHIDIENIAEEIESLGKSYRRALRSQFRRLLLHMLKLRYQPEMQMDSNSWQRSVNQARGDIEDIIRYNPSLKNMISDIFTEVYERARADASFEICLDMRVFPKECPWTIDEILEIKEGE